MTVQGNIVDIPNKRIFKGELQLENGKITSIKEVNHENEYYIIPGFIDAHIHIESSMLVPSEFAKIAVIHGTIATVSDPHEIANVLGIPGIEFMVENGKKVPLKFNFGAPSCVPATPFENAGATINAEDIKHLMANPDIKYLAEMMNYPGVIHDDEEIQKKISWAKYFQKPIDGHAPGLKGKDLTKYIAAGIHTDHECFSSKEAKEKLEKGMKIIIREGSAAKNFEALIDLIRVNYKNIMFCSDDKHPDDLLEGHINKLCARAVAKGIDLFKVLQVACINPITHYNLDVGMLQVGDAADFVVVEDLSNFKVIETYIDGKLVAENGKTKVADVPFEIINNFSATKKNISEFEYHSSSEKIRAISAIDGALITKEIEVNTLQKDGNLISNVKEDILKITVVNRYTNSEPAIGFIKNFNLKEGAIASSVGHDSHNIIAVGVSDAMLCKAVNLLIENKGGICVVTEKTENVIPLPIAGIMSDQPAEIIGKQYAELDCLAKKMGSTLSAPFMTLSFMGLLVIPSLKLSDKGLFNGDTFKFTSLEIK